MPTQKQPKKGFWVLRTKDGVYAYTRTKAPKVVSHHDWYTDDEYKVAERTYVDSICYTGWKRATGIELPMNTAVRVRITRTRVY